MSPVKLKEEVGDSPFCVVQKSIFALKLAECTSPPTWTKDLPITWPSKLDWFTVLLMSAKGAKIEPTTVELPSIFKVVLF